VLRGRERRWRVTDRLDREQRPPTALLVALVLASATLLTLDYHGGQDGPLEPVRRAVGEAFGPAEAVSAAIVRPFTAVPAWFDSRDELRADVARLSAENAELKQQVRTSGVDRHRLAEYDALTATAEQTGRALVPARVIGLGPAQSFTRTVTIDAGSRAGVHPDQTVVAADGLVGRVIRTTDTTATVLLVVDADSVVGGRVGESMELGFLKGRGVVGGDARLDLELVDGTTVPGRGDPVVTWGSEGGAPYVAGIPIGQVTQVFTSVRDSSKRAVIAPYVDFSSLDVVGVVVASGTRSDRALIEADGSLR
jgi:rod shape-determining protein MreC